MGQTTGTYYAYLVDPFAMTVTTVEIDREKDSLPQIYNHLSHDPQHKVDCITAAYTDVEGFPDMLCDDEGLFKSQKAWTKFKGREEPITGKILLSDTDDEGRSITPSMSISVVKRHIKFVDILGVADGKVIMALKGVPQ